MNGVSLSMLKAFSHTMLQASSMCSIDNIRAVQSPLEGPFPFLVTLLRRLGIPRCDWASVEDLGSVCIEHMILSWVNLHALKTILPRFWKHVWFISEYRDSQTSFKILKRRTLFEEGQNLKKEDDWSPYLSGYFNIDFHEYEFIASLLNDRGRRRRRRLFPEGWEKKVNHDVRVDQIKKTPTTKRGGRTYPKARTLYRSRAPAGCLKKLPAFILGTGTWTDSSIPYLDLRVPCDGVPGSVDEEVWPVREGPMAYKEVKKVRTRLGL
ncbi:hypothetical protein TNCV_1632461 [Trichonephila clavipes]|nr:hypothetical protein TNCV_1632461 [Trichonephila clavipes]